MCPVQYFICSLGNWDLRESVSRGEGLTSVSNSCSLHIPLPKWGMEVKSDRSVVLTRGGTALPRGGSPLEVALPPRGRFPTESYSLSRASTAERISL